MVITFFKTVIDLYTIFHLLNIRILFIVDMKRLINSNKYGFATDSDSSIGHIIMKCWTECRINVLVVLYGSILLRFFVKINCF